MRGVHILTISSRIGSATEKNSELMGSGTWTISEIYSSLDVPIQAKPPLGRPCWKDMKHNLYFLASSKKSLQREREREFLVAKVKIFKYLLFTP